MSAPYIIPFNFQPSSTVATTSNYTVPAGKYALVNIENAFLPVLNSVNLYVTKTFPSSILFGTTAIGINVPVSCKRITFNVASSASGIYFLFNSMAGTGATTAGIGLYHTAFTAGTALSIIGDFISGTSISVITGAGTNLCSSVVCDGYPTKNSIWLKAGDVLTVTSGNIVYTEYNVIS